MMKFGIIFYCILLSFGCSQNNNKSETESTDTVTKIVEDSTNFKSLKSGTFWNELEEGKFEIITNEKKFLDTIDKDWSFTKIQDNSYFYLKVSEDENQNHFNLGKDTLYGSVDHFILYEKNEKKSIKDFTRNFNDYFSSPSLINNKIYFWGMELYDSAKYIYKVYASELDLISKKSKHHLIFEDEIATDNKGYFPAPSLKKDKIVFQFDENQKWYFSKEFKLEK